MKTYPVKKALVAAMAATVLAAISFSLSSYTGCLSVSARNRHRDVVDCSITPEPVSTVFSWLGLGCLASAVIAVGVALALYLLNRRNKLTGRQISLILFLLVPSCILLSILLDKLLYKLPYHNWNHTERVLSQVIAWTMVAFVALALAFFATFITYGYGYYIKRHASNG